MFLRSLELTNFRSFPTRQFEFSPGINIVYGPNACGKTNLLEAIYTLSNLRSFRTHAFREMIHWGATQAYLRGYVQQEQSRPMWRDEEDIPAPQKAPDELTPAKTLAFGIEPNARVLVLNSKRCRSSREYLQILPSTAFIPDDLSLVKGAPAGRRYFLDRGTFQFYPPYWSLLTEYNKALQQKNALLRAVKGRTSGKDGGNRKSSSEVSGNACCEIWNQQLQRVGSKIILHRLLFIHNLQRFVNQVYHDWLENKETIRLRYKSSIHGSEEVLPTFPDIGEIPRDTLSNEIFERYGQALQKNLERECQLGMALVGPHRDDLDLDFSGRSLRSFGSQGQQRTAVLALKFAEVYLYFERYAEYSILLLDDVTSELDSNRNNKLFECLQQGMQVFISVTGKADIFMNTALPCTYFDLA